MFPGSGTVWLFRAVVLWFLLPGGSMGGLHGGVGSSRGAPPGPLFGSGTDRPGFSVPL